VVKVKIQRRYIFFKDLSSLRLYVLPKWTREGEIGPSTVNALIFGSLSPELAMATCVWRSGCGGWEQAGLGRAAGMVAVAVLLVQFDNMVPVSLCLRKDIVDCCGVSSDIFSAHLRFFICQKHWRISFYR
jgi:hypothetical protein